MTIARVPVLAVMTVIGCGGGTHLSTDATSFTCQAMTCASSQFCFTYASGFVGADPATPTAGCNDIPATCQPSTTCDCLLANTTSSCGTTLVCGEQGAHFTVTCPSP
jgi:hypothetical protein